MLTGYCLFYCQYFIDCCDSVYWLLISLFCRWVSAVPPADPVTSEPISTLFITFLHHVWLAVMFAYYLAWWCNFPLPGPLSYWVSGEQIHALLFCEGLMSPFTWRGKFVWRVGHGSALAGHRFPLKCIWNCFTPTVIKHHKRWNIWVWTDPITEAVALSVSKGNVLCMHLCFQWSAYGENLKKHA